MGCVQQAVLEFDQEVRAPWRPGLVHGDADGTGVRPVHPPSRRRPSRVGVCRPPEALVPRTRGVARGARRAEVPAVVPDRVSGARRAASARPAPTGVRLTRRARRLGVVVGLLVGVALGSWLGPLLGGGEALSLAGESSVVVRSGDTLWSIAGELQGDGDVRGLIDAIQELNGLSGADLVPGQTLRLP